jgi:hypothetical protein
MEICQRQEDSRSSIILNTSLSGLVNILFSHEIESSFRIWKNNLKFLACFFLLSKLFQHAFFEMPTCFF